jgi:hypothetical protein
MPASASAAALTLVVQEVEVCEVKRTARLALAARERWAGSRRAGTGPHARRHLLEVEFQGVRLARFQNSGFGVGEERSLPSERGVAGDAVSC